MEVTIPVEDHRGVDVARIRELLSMTVQERVQHMLAVVAVISPLRPLVLSKGSMSETTMLHQLR
jgi:hypothetical protein